MNEGTRANHMLRLRRMMRVQSGLPARIRVYGTASGEPVRMREDDQRCLEASFVDEDAGMVGAYVAAFGAKLVGADAVGAEFVDDDGVLAVQAGIASRRIVSPLTPLAEHLIGRVIGDQDWKDLVGRAEILEVVVTAEIARGTHAAMVAVEDASVLVLVTEFGVTRRQLDRAAEFGTAADPDESRALLRG